MTEKLRTLKDAIGEFVCDGDSVVMEGFTHLIPFAAGHEIIRQGRKRLRLIRFRGHLPKGGHDGTPGIRQGQPPNTVADNKRYSRPPEST